MCKNVKFKEVEEEVSSMRRKKGQSILEYAIVLTVIVAAIAFAASKFVGPAVNTTLDSSAQSITGAVNRLPR